MLLPDPVAAARGPTGRVDGRAPNTPTMTLSFRPIAGEYRRAICTAAAECDVATLQRIALLLADYYDATAPAEAGQLGRVTHSQYPAGGRVAGERGHS